MVKIQRKINNMLNIIVIYISSVTLIHLLLFTKASYMSRILLINSAISCLAVAMLLLSYYFKDTNFIDVIFFYIIMSPIGFYGLFLYYKNTAKKYENQEKSIIKEKKNNIKKQVNIKHKNNIKINNKTAK